MTVAVGSVVADTYRIEGILGRGGMGVVYLASHDRLPGKRVALKVLRAELAGDDTLARFKREAQIVSMLGHPNIVHVEDFNVTPDGTAYLVLEYLQGESLAQRLTRGPVPLELALSIARQIGSALGAAHGKGIIHRDLKPANIFLVPTEIDGRIVEQVKVLDFGISKVADSQTIKTEDNALLGTPQYMSPEQASGKHETIDVRTDVFALGTIIYEMIGGVPAFSGVSIPEIVFKVVYEQPRALSSRVPPAMVAAIDRAMAKDPDERFASVDELVEALTGKPISVTPVRQPRGADAFAQTMDSGNAAQSPLAATTLPEEPASHTAPVAKTARWRPAVLVAACAAAAAAATVIAFLALRGGSHGGAHDALDAGGMRAIAAQMLAGPEVAIDGHTFHVGQTPVNHLRIVRFTIGDHGYEAIEQNPEKPSHWGKLAREGHKIVHFREPTTGRYFGLVIDGEVAHDDVEAP